MKTTIWHNPRCSKSRQTLALLEAQGIKAAVRLYFEDRPTVTELENIAKLLGKSPIEFTRTQEDAFKEAGLTKDSTPEVILAAMAAEPKLIERPIVTSGNAAALGRPPELVLTLFK